MRITLPSSFRRILLFDHGLVYRYAHAHTAAVIRWQDIDAHSIRTVSSPNATPAESRLRTLHPAGLEPLGANGRNAVVFRATAAPLAAGSAPGPTSGAARGAARGAATGPRFFSFGTHRDLAPLVLAIHHAMLDAGIPGAADVATRALPPAVVSGPVSLDR
ncbi:hypothetical protein [Arthrobacter sp. ISL-30]|uniref:hypothetical protein n=1 Tax=Arthrobacter sp. ISL-30 TaxID=2819109 RepID=UPI001BEAACD9|nr:hypothetical protein [Arthrobacter sp. ISL-30]MBT2514954.1 hypothetical protein [Arthrobacter sp. ISL-30]